MSGPGSATRVILIGPNRVGRLLAILAFSLALLGTACGGSRQALDKAEAMRLGDEAMTQKKFGEAVKAYQSAVAVDPEDGRLRQKLARALEGARSWDLAARQFITAAEKLTDDWDAQIQGVTWMLRLSRFFDATEKVRSLQKARSVDAQLLMLEGVARSEFRNPEMGVYEVEAQMRLGRHFEGARYHLSPRRDSKPVDAERLLRQAYDLAPDKFNTRIALAGYLWIYGDWDEGAALLRISADKDPGNVQANRALGLYYDFKEKPEDAERYLKVAAAGDDRDSRLALADFYFRRKRFSDSLAILNPIAATDDPDSSAAAKAADAELSLGQHKVALNRADDLLKRRPFDPVALRVKATVLLASGDNAQALAIARSAVASAPTSRDARLALARALHASGDLPAAFAEYSEVWRSDMRDAAVAKSLAGVAFALGRDGVAEDIGSQSLRLNPGDKEAAIITARASVRLGSLAAAERALAPLASAKNPSADVLALQGTIQAARGNTDAARNTFQKALQLDRNSVDALSGLVDVEIKSARAASLRSQIDQAAAAHAGNPAYLLLVAKVAIATKDLARAESALKAILDRDAWREDATLLRSSVLVSQGRTKDAQTAIETLLEKVPASVNLRLELGDLLERQSKFAESRAQYERVIQDNQIAGGTTEALNAHQTASARLARLFANQGTNLDEALELAASAMRAQPKNAAFADTLGWVHVRKLRARLGLRYLETALKADATNPLIRYHLGVAYDQLGEIQRARLELAEALRIDPGFHGADAAKTLLRALGG